ncbi:MAG: hypothetical protein ACE3JP_08255 [Ectobacillus sp.]
MEIQKHNPADRFSTVKLDHDGFKLTLKEREIALAMLIRSQTGETVEQIGERFGMTRDGVYQIIKRNPDFKRFQAHILEEMFGALFGEAVLVLQEALSPKYPMSQRLKAVGYVLQSQGRLKNEHTLEVKQPKTLEELEAEQKERERQILELEKELLD